MKHDAKQEQLAMKESLGQPPRRFASWRYPQFKQNPSRWIDGDLCSRIYRQAGRTLKYGEVRWSAIVQANSLLFRPGRDTSGAQVVYARDENVTCEELLEIAQDCFALKGTKPSDPGERKLANMLTDEMERALDWPVPASLSRGHDLVTTIVMIERKHIPDSCLGLRHLPILADLESGLALLIPQAYWPPELAARWREETWRVKAAIDAQPAVQLTERAAEQVRLAAGKRPPGWAVRVAVIRQADGSFSYDLGFTDTPSEAQEQITESHGVLVAVDRDSIPSLLGTVIDFREDGAGSGFAFENPNVG